MSGTGFSSGLSRVEIDPHGRAHCAWCDTLIAKGTPRVARAFFHAPGHYSRNNGATTGYNPGGLQDEYMHAQCTFLRRKPEGSASRVCRMRSTCRATAPRPLALREAGCPLHASLVRAAVLLLLLHARLCAAPPRAARRLLGPRAERSACGLAFGRSICAEQRRWATGASEGQGAARAIPRLLRLRAAPERGGRGDRVLAPRRAAECNQRGSQAGQTFAKAPRRYKRGPSSDRRGTQSVTPKPLSSGAVPVPRVGVSMSMFEMKEMCSIL